MWRSDDSLALALEPRPERRVPAWIARTEPHRHPESPVVKELARLVTSAHIGFPRRVNTKAGHGVV